MGKTINCQTAKPKKQNRASLKNLKDGTDFPSICSVKISRNNVQITLSRFYVFLVFRKGNFNKCPIPKYILTIFSRSVASEVTQLVPGCANKTKIPKIQFEIFVISKK
ncbi:MAG: hypothetical protein K1Y36_22290 [Blastocatellia bacterium]|nr:hypothetical protein [Blastocatellia bacterium]